MMQRTQEQLSVRHRPDANASIYAGRSESATIRAEIYLESFARVEQRRIDRTAGLSIPQANDTVVA